MRNLTLLVAALALTLAACQPVTKKRGSGGSGGSGGEGGEGGEGGSGGSGGTGGTGGVGPEFVATIERVGAEQNAGFGRQVTLALDSAGDPLVAYSYEDENGDGVRDDNGIWFASWDAAAEDFREPVRVAELGATTVNDPFREVVLARDATSGALGIAFVKGGLEIALATSTDAGATWTAETVAAPSAGEARRASVDLALVGGEAHVAYFEDEAACNASCGAVFHARRGVGENGFTTTMVPMLPGAGGPHDTSVSLAVDAAGEPALAFFVRPGPGETSTSLVFHRPGHVAPVKITDSNALSVSAPAVSLAFEGTAPRVAFHMLRDEVQYEPTGHDVWYATSEDGNSWSAPVAVPRDGGQQTSGYVSLAFDAAGNAVITAHQTASFGPGTCGGPKLFREGATGFSACGADAANEFDFEGAYTSVESGPKGLVLAFQADRENGFTPGFAVVVWREPAVR